MKNNNARRHIRAKKTRLIITKQKIVRLSVHRSNLHIYAQLIDDSEHKTLAEASSLEPEVRKSIANGGNKKAAALVGKRIADKAINCGITKIAFDRSGYKYHGRVRALADAARESGLKF